MASSSARRRVARALWVPLLLVAALLAGCAGPPSDDGGPPTMAPYTPRPQPEPDVRCQEPAPALVHLELHTDHSGGDSVYWAVYPNGTALLARGMPTSDANETKLWAHFRGAEDHRSLLERFCHALVGHARPGWNGSIVHHGLEAKIVVERQVDLDAVHRALDAFWDLPENSGLMCLSGGDSWMQANLDNRTHSVKARCAASEAFRDVQQQVIAAVGEEPFSYW